MLRVLGEYREGMFKCSKSPPRVLNTWSRVSEFWFGAQWQRETIKASIRVRSWISKGGRVFLRGGCGFHVARRDYSIFAKAIPQKYLATLARNIRPI
jgi:hypothetical protein